MALVAKDADQILQEAMDYLRANTTLSPGAPGSKIRAILEVMKNEAASAYGVFDSYLASTLVGGASGKYLDYIGSVFGLTRNKGVAARVTSDSRGVRVYVTNGTFGTINNGNSIVLPTGTKIWAEINGIETAFYTISEATLDSTKSEEFVAVRAAYPGSDYTVPIGQLRFHSFRGYSDYTNNSLKVINTTTITNGQDEESDDNFRYRIVNHKLQSATANRTAIELAAYSVHGVSSVVFNDKGYSPGTFGVVVQSQAMVTPTEIVTEVQRAVDQVKAYGVNIAVSAPAYIYVDVVAKVKFRANTSASQKENAIANITSAVSSYINNIPMGDTMNYNAIANLILGSSSQIESVGTNRSILESVTVRRTIYDTAVVEKISKDYSCSEGEKLVHGNTTIEVL